MDAHEAEEFVKLLEKFIDANIDSALRQVMPEVGDLRWDINDLYNARAALIRHLKLS